MASSSNNATPSDPKVVGPILQAVLDQGEDRPLTHATNKLLVILVSYLIVWDTLFFWLVAAIGLSFLLGPPTGDPEDVTLFRVAGTVISIGACIWLLRGARRLFSRAATAPAAALPLSAAPQFEAMVQEIQRDFPKVAIESFSLAGNASMRFNATSHWWQPGPRRICMTMSLAQLVGLSRSQFHALLTQAVVATSKPPTMLDRWMAHVAMRWIRLHQQSGPIVVWQPLFQWHFPRLLAWLYASEHARQFEADQQTLDRIDRDLLAEAIVRFQLIQAYGDHHYKPALEKQVLTGQPAPNDICSALVSKVRNGLPAEEAGDALQQEVADPNHSTTSKAPLLERLKRLGCNDLVKQVRDGLRLPPLTEPSALDALFPADLIQTCMAELDRVGHERMLDIQQTCDLSPWRTHPPTEPSN